MKFNVYFTIKGPAGQVEARNNTNHLECANLASLLAQLAENLPHNDSLGIETVGIRIDPVDGSV